MHVREQRTPPQPLGGCAGVAIWGGDCGELAGALDLLAGILAGHTPPASTKAARMTRRLEMMREILSQAAREQASERHRHLAAIAQSQPLPTPTVVAPAQPGGSSTPATIITTRQAAELLGVTEQRVRVLAASGRITARRGVRAVWEIDRTSTVAYRERRARRRTIHGETAGRAAGGRGA